MLVSLMIDVHGELVDDLAQTMCADEARSFRIDGSQTIAAFRSMLEEFYSWIADVDFGDKPANARVWYVSEEKLEPRLGERFEEPLEPYEQPLSPARDIERMKANLEQFGDNKKLGAFLMKHPHHRHVARRVQIASKLPYAEIRDNTIDAEMVPIDLLRCKLSFFGATKFDPKSDRWTRISLFQGAPFPHELADCDPDDMAYPPLMGN